MVLAMIAVARAGGANWEDSVALANVAGGLEVERFGSVPILPREIIDELLSEARIMVLEDGGYDVIAVDLPAAALRVLRTKPIRLVVVCHSVPPPNWLSCWNR